jgi:iron-sulfur cluster insertion protein
MSLVVTDNAAAQILKLMKSESSESFLRISILGGGCSGFQYNITIDDEMTGDDLVFENGVAKVVIDDISLGLLNGGVLDYVSDMVASKFVITNPNASAGCGCGNSFAL